MTKFRSVSKCFVNNQCTWRTCASCINKQLKFNGLDAHYECPHCKKESIFYEHTRFTKFCKSNRGTLLKIYKLQQEAIKVCYAKLEEVNALTSPENINYIYNQTINSTMINELPFTEIDLLGTTYDPDGNDLGPISIGTQTDHHIEISPMSAITTHLHTS